MWILRAIIIILFILLILSTRAINRINTELVIIKKHIDDVNLFIYTKLNECASNIEELEDTVEELQEKSKTKSKK